MRVPVERREAKANDDRLSIDRLSREKIAAPVGYEAADFRDRVQAGRIRSKKNLPLTGFLVVQAQRESARLLRRATQDDILEIAGTAPKRTHHGRARAVVPNAIVGQNVLQPANTRRPISEE